MAQNLQNQSTRDLATQIEDKRAEMMETVEEWGIHATATIQCSQELDELIVAYQKLERCVNSRPAPFSLNEEHKIQQAM